MLYINKEPKMWKRVKMLEGRKGEQEEAAKIRFPDIDCEMCEEICAYLFSNTFVWLRSWKLMSLHFRKIAYWYLLVKLTSVIDIYTVFKFIKYDQNFFSLFIRLVENVVNWNTSGNKACAILLLKSIKKLLCDWLQKATLKDNIGISSFRFNWERYIGLWWRKS